MSSRKILDTIDIGIITVKINGIILTVNKAAEKVLDCKKEHIVGRTLDEVIPGINMDKILDTDSNKWQNIVIKGKNLAYKAAPMLLKGKPKEIVISLCELSDFRDLFPEKDTTQKLKNQIENLNGFVKKLTAIFDYCFDEIYVTDGKGYTIFVSKACEEFYGVKAGDLLGKHVYELEKKGMFSRSVTREVLHKKEQVTMIQTTKKGKKLLVTANPIFNEKGEIDSVVTISRDITELSILKEKLAETEELSAMYLSELEKLKKEQPRQQEIIAQSEPIKEILEMVKRIARVDSTVLIEGESGVGKGVFASRIHALSKRRDKPFIAVNCGAIPENLMESELFGYEPGAFTGARKSGKKGLFEIAQGGTVFLDEITEIPLNLQVKLLQVIQDKKFRRVGGNKDIDVDIRIIAATNQDIQKLVKEGKFREDLFYRLNVIPLWIPPLRHRRDDIVPLAKHFLKKFNDDYRLNKEISDDAQKILVKYDWPGNVRELENLIERLVVTTDGNLIKSFHLPDYVLRSAKMSHKDVIVLNICPLKKGIEEVESQLIKKAYENYGNTYKIAEILQVSQSTVVRKIHKYLGKCTNELKKMHL